jgi:hypothetical protein
MDASQGLSRHHLNRAFFLLVGCELLLVAAYLIHLALGSPTWTITRLVNLDGENSVPAWFSSMQLFVIGALFLSRAAFRRKDRDPALLFILLLAAAFLFLSMDEALFIHETIAKLLRPVDWLPRTENGLPVWILLYPSVALPVLLLSARQALHMWRQHRSAASFMMLGAFTFVAGAAGMEAVAYELVIPHFSALYPLSVAVEEFMEMLGATLVLYGAAVFALPLSAPAQSEGAAARAPRAQAMPRPDAAAG